MATRETGKLWNFGNMRLNVEGEAFKALHWIGRDVSPSRANHLQK
jgi:hypothetical protein